MANLLQSSQDVTTQAPSYYTNYLSNLANQGTTAAGNAQYVGAQPLQEQAFQNVGEASTAYQPTLNLAGQTLGTVAGSASPLTMASNYLNAATTSPALLAQQYMNPYTQSVVNNLGDVGMRNIQQNLAPSATAGAVGSGQFGSKRGAEVLGQTMSNAERDILNAQMQALSTGYGQALTAAGNQNTLMGQLGSTAGQLQSSGQQNLTQAGNALSNLAGQNQQLGLAGINALSTLGGQQQTIAQNQQLFPLNNLSTLSGILRGYNIPTSTSTTMNMSPLSAIGAIGAGAMGLTTPGTGGTTPLDNIKAALGITGSINANNGNINTPTSQTQDQAVSSLQNQGYTLDPNTGYLTKDGTNYALDANNNPVEVGPAEGYVQNPYGSGYVDSSTLENAPLP